MGRITQKAETIDGITTTYAYHYDLAGRLDEVKQNDVIVEAYGYDDNGNRLTAETANGSVIANYDDQDRLIQYGNVSYTLTSNGELRRKDENGQVTENHYDVLGNLRAVQLPNGNQLEYVIDGRDRRIGKKVNGQLVQGFLYQGSLNPVAELDTNGNIVTRFVYGGRRNVPAYLIKNGQTFRVIADSLGSPWLVINIATGEVAQQIDYDEFGQVQLDTNPGFQPFGFAGGIYDLDTGLVRFGARDYDPEVGRWTAKDPIDFDGGDANLYGYIWNDPINSTDPSGLVCGHGGCIVIGIGVVRGGKAVYDAYRAARAAARAAQAVANEIGDDDVDTPEGSGEEVEDNEATGEQCPTEPVGSLKKPNEKWLKKQGVDPHALKKNLGDSRLDIYVDKAGNIWTLPKNQRGVSPQWEGHLDHFKD